MARLGVRTSSQPWIRAVLGFFGVYCLALGLFVVVAPGTFYDTLGPFGARNDHYLRDYASLVFANALLLLMGLRRPGWRVPALAFTTLQWLLHGLNHLWDIGDTNPPWVGVFDFFALAVGFVVLVSALGLAVREAGR